MEYKDTPQPSLAEQATLIWSPTTLFKQRSAPLGLGVSFFDRPLPFLSAFLAPMLPQHPF